MKNLSVAVRRLRDPLRLRSLTLSVPPLAAEFAMCLFLSNESSRKDNLLDEIFWKLPRM
jgi:hypothetical protein